MLQSLVSNPCIDEVNPNEITSNIELCIRNLIGAAENIYLAQQSNQELINLYRQQLFFDLRIKALPILYSYSSYSVAENYLQQFANPCTQEHYDYIAIQNIKIDILENGFTHYLTQSDYDLIEDIARKSDPLASYAAGLYFSLTEQWIGIEYPNISEIGTIPRQIKEDSQSGIIKIHPNPANSFLEIEIQGYSIEDLQVIFYNSNGEEIRTISEVKMQNKVPIVQLPEGLYFLTFLKSGKIVKTEKITIIH